jgi:hypothetical protein
MAKFRSAIIGCGPVKMPAAFTGQICDVTLELESV